MKKQWQKKEAKDALDFQGKRTPRSGGFWSFPGDVASDQFLIDSKITKQKSYSLTKNIWDKISHEALKSRKMPLLSISIIDDENELELCVLDKNDLIELLQKYEK
jgi:hypothetical protein